MKNVPLVLVACLSAVGLAGTMNGQETVATPPPAPVSDYPETGMVPQQRMLHIGIVVRDIEKARDHWMKFLGLQVRPTIMIAAGHEANPTQYRGKPSTAKARLVFMNLDNLQVELIEPLGDEPSHWREFLEAKGEGVHHVAFAVKGMGEQYLEKYAEVGYSTAQHGGWATGEYGYMDTMQALGVTVELIENYNNR
jgi:methylmalonyl-CoA/ethylmalonyl-CoA epimerase